MWGCECSNELLSFKKQDIVQEFCATNCILNIRCSRSLLHFFTFYINSKLFFMKTFSWVKKKITLWCFWVVQSFAQTWTLGVRQRDADVSCLTWSKWKYNACEVFTVTTISFKSLLSSHLKQMKERDKGSSVTAVGPVLVGLSKEDGVIPFPFYRHHSSST